MIDNSTKDKLENETPHFGNTLLGAVPSEVFNEDCITVMKRYPDKFFDLAVVDPPYGLGDKLTQGGTWASKYAKGDASWDIAPPAEYWEQLFRVSKNQIVWGGNYFTEYLKPSKCWVFWDKQFDKTFNFSHGELAWTSFNKQLLKVTKSSKAETNGGKDRIHPTQKPVYIYDWLLSNFKEGSLNVLDTHVGSGSSRIACHKAGLQFVGFEIDKDYYEAQEKRFKDFVSQLRMF